MKYESLGAFERDVDECVCVELQGFAFLMSIMGDSLGCSLE